MRILVSGSHGLVGKALISALSRDGNEIVSLVRKTSTGKGEIEWHPNKGTLDPKQLEGFDAVVHLAGESIASGRWTDEKKQRIRESRVQGTTLLSKALSSLSRPPATFVAASAIGYYGNRGDELLSEASLPGNDFLSEVCVAWEKSTGPAETKGIRTVHTRFGVILAVNGGALEKMLTPFRLGVGGKVGDGKQWMSWIAIDDVVGGLQFVLNNQDIHGPVNFTAPNPVKNEDFTDALGKTLSRPTIFPVPAFAARLAFGEMADALLLSSARVEPAKLREAGYQFKYSELKPALLHILKN